MRSNTCYKNTCNGHYDFCRAKNNNAFWRVTNFAITTVVQKVGP